MIRITGGRFRGQNLTCPKGKDIRPTTAFVRESLFSILGPRLLDARVLDLFAGCGIVGFEALSRGARCVEAVERSGSHCRILEQNRAHLRLDDSDYVVRCQSVEDWLKHPTTTGFDVVFMDPPYRLDNPIPIIETCFQKRVVLSGGILICESGQRSLPEPTGALQVDTRTYGSSTLFFFSYPPEPEPQTE